MEKENMQSELPPFLKEAQKRGDGFQVPDGYFEDLEKAVFARLMASGGLRRPVLMPVGPTARFRVALSPRTAAAMAAAVALVLAAVWFVRPKPGAPAENATTASATLTEEDIAAYLLENAHEFEPQLLAVFQTEGETAHPGGANDSKAPQKPRKTEIRPEDLDAILDSMTDEELQQIL